MSIFQALLVAVPKRRLGPRQACNRSKPVLAEGYKFAVPVAASVAMQILAMHVPD